MPGSGSTAAASLPLPTDNNEIFRSHSSELYQRTFTFPVALIGESEYDFDTGSGPHLTVIGGSVTVTPLPPPAKWLTTANVDIRSRFSTKRFSIRMLLPTRNVLVWAKWLNENVFHLRLATKNNNNNIKPIVWELAGQVPTYRCKTVAAFEHIRRISDAQWDLTF